MSKLYSIILKSNLEMTNDKEYKQYLFQLLNILTLKLLETNIPEHKNSRLSKCKCCLCRYQELCELITQKDFPEELTMPRKSPDYSLKFIPKTIKSLNISHTLLTQLFLPKSFSNLIHLNLSSTNMINNCISTIIQYSSLKILSINECKVKDSIFKQLKDLSLDELYCSHNLLTNSIIEELKESNLSKSIKILDISNNNLTNSSLSSFIHYPLLSLLILKGNSIDQRYLKNFVSRHSNYKYNGMNLIKTGIKYDKKVFELIDSDWGNDKFCETLCKLGMTQFKQEQISAKSSTDIILFSNK